MWSEESQQTRMELARAWLLELVQVDDQVLDFGCGTARFAEFMPAVATYFGWDWSPAMRERAQHDHREVTILDTDPLEGPPYDHVVALGTFNLQHNWSKLETLDTLVELWALARRSLIVSLYRGQASPDMIRYELDDIVRLFERCGFPALSVTNEHLSNDWMVRLVHM